MLEQALGRLGLPWRFAEFPLREAIEPPADAELEAVMRELDFRIERDFEREDEPGCDLGWSPPEPAGDDTQ